MKSNLAGLATEKVTVISAVGAEQLPGVVGAEWFADESR
jgi:hypothetical protein